MSGLCTEIMEFDFQLWKTAKENIMLVINTIENSNAIYDLNQIVIWQTVWFIIWKYKLQIW